MRRADPFFRIAGLGLFRVADLNGASLLTALPECQAADWSALKCVVYGASPIPLPVLRVPPRSSAVPSCSPAA